MEATGSSFLTCSLRRDSKSMWVTCTHPPSAPQGAPATRHPRRAPRLRQGVRGQRATGAEYHHTVMAGLSCCYPLTQALMSIALPEPSNLAVPRPSLSRTGHVLTGQIPGMLGGGWGFSMEAVSPNALKCKSALP